ncbi:hypothetical protein SAMN04488117_10893 [Celeribacter baekdonensis]|uniref:Uncharacterized protein n=1 Tax=Celeribacter baekdonensis TaxID=875171 RepID=A0A1G7PPV2_9RHOB|nr:hypothetical protein [Celeribacter baekdonensis]SDF87629.1 hypothetical protein SAMN04488117_10893 [Celeribacter baekdonensis]
MNTHTDTRSVAYIDTFAIEQQAHQMRAEAAREMVLAFGKWLRRRFAASHASKSHASKLA